MSKLKESFILNVAFPLADKLMGTCAMKWYRQICKMNTWSIRGSFSCHESF